MDFSYYSNSPDMKMGVPFAEVNIGYVCDKTPLLLVVTSSVYEIVPE